MLKRTFTVFTLLLLNLSVFSQTAPFNIAIEPMEIPGIGGLQAYAYGQHNGKWLIIGGRLDGLHRRQPFAAFDVSGNNIQLLVVDPLTKEKWSAPLSSLPAGMQEQLSSTNMNFHQDGDNLYIVGGYGFSATANAKKTFENLTAVNVPAVIDAIIAATPFASHFRQVFDEQFAVTGGHLQMINNTFYLVGGNRFDGNYNPAGNPTYVQVYTDAIRKFKVDDDGTTLSITHLPTITDAANLHRRDYNAVPQVLPTGEEGITVFSGVFQVNADLPFLHSVNIDSVSYAVNPNFQQYYNHYHCPVLPMYSAVNNEMHNVFFGGIAQFYDSQGTLVQDDNVPFVNTIARVSRTANGAMAEYKLPIVMPSLLGAGAEFIPITTVPHYANDVLKLDEFTADSTLVGYIYGGISSTAPNIFFTNMGTQSSASNQLFKVYVIKDGTTGTHDLNEQSIGSLKVSVYPNPNEGNFTIKFHLDAVSETKVTMTDLNGRVVEQSVLKNLNVGENTFQIKDKKNHFGGTYFLTIETKNEKAVQKIVIKR